MSTDMSPFASSPVQRSVATMDFADAMREVAKDKKVTKEEWGNPDIYVALFFMKQINPDTPDGRYLCIRKADGTVHTLVVSDGDMLGEDWTVIE